MERRADDAERELLQWKKVKFMADKVGDEFEGYVTGVAAFGLFIELIEHFVEGLVHVSTMADDYYRFVESAHMLRGENTQKVYRLGDKVKVQVIRVNMEVRQIDLGLVEILERVREGERGPRRSKAAPKFEKKRKQRPGRRERKAERDTKHEDAKTSWPQRQEPDRSAAAAAWPDRIDTADRSRRHRRHVARAAPSNDRAICVAACVIVSLCLVAMKSIVVGTAGHIDHGKSALVLALTGTDPDRLKEEKARGITIDLGFAHQEIDGINFAFVDVPGHERFVKNMLAGVGGIDLVVLVVAADESVMPQTREHFDICRLLRVPRRPRRADQVRSRRCGHAGARAPRSPRARRRLVSRGRADRAGVGADRRRARRLRATLAEVSRADSGSRGSVGRPGCRSIACSR